MPHVFISYATGDQAHADEVCRLLEQHGARCWIATRDQVAGANYDEAIVRAIDAAEAVVFLLTFDKLFTAATGRGPTRVERLILSSLLRRRATTDL